MKIQSAIRPPLLPLVAVLGTLLQFTVFQFTALQFTALQVAAQESAQDPLAKGKPASATVVLIGDSTVSPTDGWGPGFAELLAEGVACHNAAMNGRSSRSFRTEGLWDKMLEHAREAGGDYLLIQFGHNDQPGKGPERESAHDGDFRKHLEEYVKEAQTAGMQPILVTSLTRRRWGADGKIDTNLQEYADATTAVAKKLEVPLIDLHALSIAQCNSIGPKEFEKYEPVGEKGIDHTHLTPEGSRLVGKLVADELQRVLPETKRLFN